MTPEVRKRFRWALATATCGWILLANVYGQFTPARRKLVRSPQPGGHGISVVVDRAQAPTDDQWVLVCVVRNEGTAPVDISVSVAGQVRRARRIAQESSSRIDVAMAAPRDASGTVKIEVSGSPGTWSLAYLELANLHGFTRGAVDLLVLPAAQPFGKLPSWWIAVLVAGALLLWPERPLPWPWWVRVAWVGVAGVVGAIFLAIAVAPFVSPFRIVLSAGTFSLGVLVLAAPRIATLVRQLSMSEVVGARLKGVPWPAVLSMVALCAYAAFLASHVGAYAGGADSSGYMNSARLLREGRIATPMRVVAGVSADDMPPFAYVPLGFRPRGPGEMVPTYPTGLPLAALATAALTGWDRAPAVTMVIHGVLGVVLMFLLGRWAGLSRGWASLGALVLATSPQYLFSSVWFMSDTPALVWTTAAVLLAWRSRRDARWAVPAGAAVAISVLVRPTNILVMAPVAVCLGLSPLRWAWLVVGGVPGAAFLLLYNRAAYEGALSTGYVDTGVLFTLANVLPALQAYVAWFPVLLTPLVALALGLPFVWRRAPARVAALVLWITSFAVVYTFYYHTHEAWWYLRFLQPIFPPLIAGALLVGRALVARVRLSSPSVARRTGAWVGGIALAAAVLAHSAKWSERLHATEIGRGEHAYVEAADWARAHLPRNSVIAAMQVTGAFFYYTDFPLLRWDSFNPQNFPPVVAALGKSGQPLYAVLFPFERDGSRVLTERLPGKWALVGNVGETTIWRFEGPLP